MAIRTNPQTAGTTKFSSLIVCTANGLRLHFPTITTRGAGYVAEAPEDGPAALQDLRPQDAGELERGVIPCPIYIKGTSECRVLL